MLKPVSTTSRAMQYLQRPRIILTLLALMAAVLTLRVFLFISRYAVNILYWDQWSFYAPLFENQGVWQLFTSWDSLQHGGLGMLAAATLANLTGWNSRADAFASGAFMCVAVVLALILKWRLFRFITYFDIVIPLLFLTLFQFETWVIMPVLWGGALPVLLIMMYCLVLPLRRPVWRYLILAGLNFLLVYTGKGMFMGFVTVVLFGMEIWQRRRQQQSVLWPALALVVALATALSFFISFHFQTGISNFGVSGTYLAEYPVFVSLMLAAFWGWHMRILGQLMPMIAGALLLVISIAILVYRVRRLAQAGISGDQLSAVIAALISYSLIFCFVTAVGRIPLGLQQAQVSRYVPLMIPGYLGWYFHILSTPPPKMRQLFLAAFLAISVVGSLPTGIIEAQALKIAESKENWKRCYLQYEDIQVCNELTGSQIYPGIGSLTAEMEYLKAHRLNLYLDAGE